MKRILFSLALGLFLSFTNTIASRGATQVSVDFFYEQLAPYGDWFEVGDYGYCWHPRDIAEDWRPYTVGRWVYTDAGWTWDSDEPFAWAVYHYGRWAHLERVGWVWVPGREWAPAWVSWRRSPRYVGWAPLPPEAKFSPSEGISSRVDVDYDIGPSYYSFVEVRNFGAPRLQRVIVEPRENISIIQRTTNVTHITYSNNTVYNEGPQYEVISRESSEAIPRLRLERRENLGGDGRHVRSDELRTRVEGNTLRVVAIPVDTKSATPPSKVGRRVERPEVDHGWKNAGPPEEVARVRAQIRSGTPAPNSERGSGEEPPQPGVSGTTNGTKREEAPGETREGWASAIPRSSPGHSPAVGAEPSNRGNEKRENTERTGRTPESNEPSMTGTARREGRAEQTPATSGTSSRAIERQGRHGGEGREDVQPSPNPETATPARGSRSTEPSQTRDGGKYKGKGRGTESAPALDRGTQPGESTTEPDGEQHSRSPGLESTTPSERTAPRKDYDRLDRNQQDRQRQEAGRESARTREDQSTTGGSAQERRRSQSSESARAGKNEGNTRREKRPEGRTEPRQETDRPSSKRDSSNSDRHPESGVHEQRSVTPGGETNKSPNERSKGKHEEEKPGRDKADRPPE